MKIKKIIYIISVILAFDSAVANDSKLNKELESIISEDDKKTNRDEQYMYDIEPVEDDIIKRLDIVNTVRRHENYITQERLKRRKEVNNFLKQNYKN